eukprot:4327917-Pyramimonas_sp.AAC.1
MATTRCNRRGVERKARRWSECNRAQARRHPSQQAYVYDMSSQYHARAAQSLSEVLESWLSARSTVPLPSAPNGWRTGRITLGLTMSRSMRGQYSDGGIGSAPT